MARKIFSKSFWADTVERAVKTAAQAPLLALGLSDSGPVNAFGLDVGLAGGFLLGGFVISVLTSLASAPIGDAQTASVLPATALPPPVPPP